MNTFSNLVRQIKQENLFPLFVIMGSTASGKTKLATALARLISSGTAFEEASILSMDSRQVYKGLDIGTGKDLFEYEKLKYYLIDIWSPMYKGNVKDFQMLTANILKNNSAYILSGGSAFYIKNIFFPKKLTQDKSDIQFTSRLEEFYSKEKLKSILKNRSLHNYRLTDTNSKRRMARSIELSRKGILIQEYKYSLPAYLKNYIPIFIRLQLPRENLKHNIKLRLRERIESGMIEESKNLLQNNLLTIERMKSLGLEYKWIALHLENKISLEEMEASLYKDISRMAKVQNNFFRNFDNKNYMQDWKKEFEKSYTNNQIEKSEKKLKLDNFFKIHSFDLSKISPPCKDNYNYNKNDLLDYMENHFWANFLNNI